MKKQLQTPNSKLQTNIYSTNRINALGLKGPEQTPEAIKQFIKTPIEHIQVDNDNIEESENILYKKAQKIFTNSGDKVALPQGASRPTSEATHKRSDPQAKRPENLKVFIGGDHSITYPLLKAFQEKNSNPFLVIFDAHVDCDFCANEPTHEEWLRGIVEQGFNPEKIILIGARKMWDVEKEFLNKHNIKVFKEIYDMEAAADYVTEKANGHDLYISIDIDALDPAFAPAVSYPEPNGLTSKEFFYILDRLLKVKSLKAIDIVEAIPEKDKAFDNRTLRTIKKIIEEAIASTV